VTVPPTNIGRAAHHSLHKQAAQKQIKANAANQQKQQALAANRAVIKMK